MRRDECRWTTENATRLLAEAETVHLASTTPEGKPVLRALHAVYVGNLVAFHGAKAGERKRCLGRPAIVSAERILANVPSYFVDPERACPATTYYQSAQATGLLEEIVDVDEKAAIVQALMEKYQSEGGYTTLDASSPLYKKAIKGVLVFGVRVEALDGKIQIGQRRVGAERTRILEGLWQRGSRRDLQAIDTMVASRPEEPFARLAGPTGTHLRCQLGEPEIAEVVHLLRGTYWNRGTTDAAIARAHRQSSAWIGCHDTEHRVVGSARAVADGVKYACIFDVIVNEPERSAGVGSALLQLLLDHPRVRDCESVGLVTRDAEAFYQRFGFEITGVHAPSGFHQMLLRRGALGTPPAHMRNPQRTSDREF